MPGLPDEEKRASVESLVKTFRAINSSLRNSAFNLGDVGNRHKRLKSAQQINSVVSLHCTKYFPAELSTEQQRTRGGARTAVQAYWASSAQRRIDSHDDFALRLEELAKRELSLGGGDGGGANKGGAGRGGGVASPTGGGSSKMLVSGNAATTTTAGTSIADDDLVRSEAAELRTAEEEQGEENAMVEEELVDYDDDDFIGEEEDPYLQYDDDEGYEDPDDDDGGHEPCF